VTLDPAPLFFTNDRDYHTLFKLVTDEAVEQYNRAHGGK
jgi:hypothetical protein